MEDLVFLPCGALQRGRVEGGAELSPTICGNETAANSSGSPHEARHDRGDGLLQGQQFITGAPLCEN